MAQLVSMGAKLACTMGDAPSALTVVDLTIPAEFNPGANIMDHVTAVNIMPFGTCKTLTSAAAGVPTPCVPATTTPWTPGSPTVMLRGAPALNNTSKCACTVGGMISIVDPGTTKESTA